MEQPPPFWAAKALADYVRGQASWRRTKAAQFPDDPRNASSANALERLALFIDDLQPTDRDLVELIELGAFNDRDELLMIKRLSGRWWYPTGFCDVGLSPAENAVKEAREALQKHYPEFLLKHVIRQCTKFAQASSEGIPIFAYDAESKGAQDIQAVLDEVRARIGDPVKLKLASAGDEPKAAGAERAPGVRIKTAETMR